MDYTSKVIFEDGREFIDRHSSLENAINYFKWCDEEYPNDIIRLMEIRLD